MLFEFIRYGFNRTTEICAHNHKRHKLAWFIFLKIHFDDPDVGYSIRPYKNNLLL